MNKKTLMMIGGGVCTVLLVLAIYLNWPSSPPPVDPKLVHEFEADAQANPRTEAPPPPVDPSAPPPRTGKGAR